MDETATSIQRLLALPTNDDLYLEIGQHLSGRPAFPQPPRQLIEIGKRWCRETLATTVCRSDKLKALAKQDMPTHELVVCVGGVLDIFSHLLGGVPVITAAALIVRLGLHKFCATVWASAHEPEKTNG